MAPEIVSENHLSFKDLEEILREAKKYGTEIIPSFYTPGHVEHILITYPKFGQIDIHVNHSQVALDITNPQAISFVKMMLDEIMDIFQESTHIHIGADEYMEFDRDPFVSDVMPYLNQYAKEHLGEGYTWKDVVANYIHEIAKHVYQKCFKPRIWNDGIYYGEKDTETPPHKKSFKTPNSMKVY